MRTSTMSYGFSLTSVTLAFLFSRAFSQCQVGYNAQINGCYKFFAYQLSKADAEEQCQQDNGYLVSIHSSIENNYIANLTQGATVWIGLMQFNQDYVWSDGSALDYTNWYQAFPNAAYGQCAILLPGVQYSNQWINGNCPDQKPFVCKTTFGASTAGPNTCPPPFYYNAGTIQSPGYPVQYGNNINCDYHLTVPAGSTITIKFSSDFVTEKCCDIVTIYDGPDSRAKVLRRLSGMDGAGQVITSSTNYLYIAFSTDATNTFKGWSAYFNATQTTSGSCGSDWHYDPVNQYCYKLFKYENTWNSASSYCESIGAELVSIHSGWENDYVMNNVIINALGSFDYYVWSGLNSISGQLAWSDGSPIDYRDWLQGEPNFNNRQCMALQAWTPVGWRMAQCSTTLPFICKRPAS